MLALLLLALAGPDQASAGCGHVKRAPRDGPVGSVPLAVGDSVMLGAAWKLSRNGFEVDAKCGRSPRGGLYVLRRRRARGTLPEIVVVALGTNFYMRSRDVSRMLRVLGPRRTLMLVTPFRSGRPVGGVAIRAAARRRPGRVRVI